MKSFSRATKMLVLSAVTATTVLGSAQGASAASARCSSSGTVTTCYQLTSTAKSSFKTLWTDGLRNTTSKAQSMTCKVDATKSDSWTASTSVSASVGVPLIGDMDASVSASVQSSVSTTVGSSITYTVPAHTVVYCDRGEFRYVGTIKKTGANGQHALPTTTFTITAPTAIIWQTRQASL